MTPNLSTVASCLTSSEATLTGTSAPGESRSTWPVSQKHAWIWNLVRFYDDPFDKGKRAYFAKDYRGTFWSQKQNVTNDTGVSVVNTHMDHIQMDRSQFFNLEKKTKNVKAGLGGKRSEA